MEKAEGGMSMFGEDYGEFNVASLGVIRENMHPGNNVQSQASTKVDSGT